FDVWGADVVLARNNVQILAELFGGDNTEAITAEPPFFPSAIPIFHAWYAEAIVRHRTGFEPAIRFEYFDPNRDDEDDGRTVWTGQLAYSFSPNFRWQVNGSR